MKRKLNLYLASGTSVYMSDGVAEALIHTFEDAGTAEIVALLLNEAYLGAYQDGRSAAFADSHPDIMNKLISLSIRNQRIEQRIKEIDSSEQI